MVTMMIQESIFTTWAYMYSWFTTPTLLFLLLNLMIGTIAITSSLGSDKHQSQQQPNHDVLAQAPSFLLERLKSLNLYRYKSQDLLTLQDHPPPPAEETQETTTTREDEKEELASVDKNPDEILGGSSSSCCRDESESTELGDSKLGNSGRVDEGTEEVNKIGRSRASSVKRQLMRRGFGDDDLDREVDAKADDFIKRFKYQLRLQRLDSIMRYKEMLSGGTTGK